MKKGKKQQQQQQQQQKHNYISQNKCYNIIILKSI